MELLSSFFLSHGRLARNAWFTHLVSLGDFRIAATRLAVKGVELADIAGNDTVILVTVIADARTHIAAPGSRILFEQPILTEPGRKRTALVLPVPQLSKFLAMSQQQGIDVEHVYDY